MCGRAAHPHTVAQSTQSKVSSTPATAGCAAKAVAATIADMGSKILCTPRTCPSGMVSASRTSTQNLCPHGAQTRQCAPRGGARCGSALAVWPWPELVVRPLGQGEVHERQLLLGGLGVDQVTERHLRHTRTRCRVSSALSQLSPECTARGEHGVYGARRGESTVCMVHGVGRARCVWPRAPRRPRASSACTARAAGRTRARRVPRGRRRAPGRGSAPMPHMVHGLSSAPRGRCTAWGVHWVWRSSARRGCRRRTGRGRHNGAPPSQRRARTACAEAARALRTCRRRPSSRRSTA